MDLTSGLLMTLAAFCLVTLRVLQQQNVIHRLFVWGAVTSYAIAFADIALILYVVKIGWASALEHLDLLVPYYCTRSFFKRR